jgi:hypothetical protein
MPAEGFPMTEIEWQECTDPIAMVEFLRGSPTGEDTVTWANNRWQIDTPPTGNDRKFRLFACACCRRIWEHIPEPCNRDAVVAVEDFVEGRLDGGVLSTALTASSAVEWKEDGSGRRSEPGYWAVKYLGRGFYKMTAAASALLISSLVVCLANGEYGREAGEEFASSYYMHAGVFLRPFRWPEPIPAGVATELATQAALLRCIFGNPFAPVDFDSAWRTLTILSLAQAAYDVRILPVGTLDPDQLLVLSDALEDAGCANHDILAHLRDPEPHGRGCWGVDWILGKE